MLLACRLRLKGLIGKLADSPYESHRSMSWIKLKCGKRQAFLICGYTDPKRRQTYRKPPCSCAHFWRLWSFRYSLKQAAIRVCMLSYHLKNCTTGLRSRDCLKQWYSTLPKPSRKSSLPTIGQKSGGQNLRGLLGERLWSYHHQRVVSAGRPGLVMSAPIAWHELHQLTHSAHWTAEKIAECISVDNSVWDGYAETACRLKDASKILDCKKS